MKMQVVVTRDCNRGHIEIGFDPDSFDWKVKLNGTDIPVNFAQESCSIEEFASNEHNMHFFAQQISQYKDAGVAYILGRNIPVAAGSDEYQNLLRAREEARQTRLEELQTITKKNIAAGKYIRILSEATASAKLTIETAQFLTEEEQKQFLYPMLSGVDDKNSTVLTYITPSKKAELLGTPSKYSLCGCHYLVWILTPEKEAELIKAENEAAEAHKASASLYEVQLNPAYQGMTAEELKRAEKLYDDINNEGAEGYNPYRDNLFVTSKRKPRH